MKIITLGPKGTYSHEATSLAMRRLNVLIGRDLELCFGQLNERVLEQAAAEQCFAMVPIENSDADLVTGVVKGFWLRQEGAIPIHVIGELELPIHHNLLGHPTVESMDSIKEGLSHEQALAQSSDALEAANIEKRTCSSTAEAAKLVAEGKMPVTVAAIASEFAAREYGLKVLAEDIANSNGNTTRFHLLGPMAMSPTGRDRTAMIFWLANKPRALVNALWAISCDGADMSSIHWKNLGTFGKVAIYCEFDQHCDAESGQAILNRLRTVTERIMVLGSFPQGR